MMRTHYINEVKKSKAARVENAKHETVRIAGWVYDFRDLGRLKFVLVRDRTGILQVTAKKGSVPDELLDSIRCNREDVVVFDGVIAQNKIAPDGVELIPSGFELLNKVARKLPVDTSDAVPSELDTRLDYRYVDLRRKKITAIFGIKSAVAAAFREFLLREKFVEIHPSCITGAATEGGADVFSIQYFESMAYLVQSPQLYKQLAVIGGFDRVFMTVPVFRAEKHNTVTHLNEVLQMDIEMGFADHEDAMDMLEKVTLHILKSVSENAKDELSALGVKLHVPKKIPWYAYTELVEKLNNAGVAMDWGWDFSKEAERKLQDILGEELYFVYEWPTAIRAFYSMPLERDERKCNAFDLVYRGLEISSGAQRIHNVELLESQLRKRGLDSHNFEFYLNAFRMGAPPHAGWSIGLERLTMKICNLDNIREATLFPRDRTRLHP